MQITTIRHQLLASAAAAALLLTACDHNPSQWKTPNMTALTPRLQAMFDKTRTICFGRFMVDVPASATAAWGEVDVPLGVTFYPDGVDEVKAEAQKFIDELKSEKAIYHNKVSLLLSVEDLAQPEGKIVTGYDGFEAIDDLKISGYFRLNNNGFIIDARPLRDQEDETIADIKSMARRLRQLGENETPTEPGNCVESAFLPDGPDDEKDHPGELVSVGFRLKEFPDAHFSIEIGPSNPSDPEGDSLERQWKLTKENTTTPEEKKSIANTKIFRESPRQIRDWKTGYEVLTRTPDEDDSHSHHEFRTKFIGVPHDPFKPYADIQFQTGVADNAAGATTPSLTDEEAIAVWDKITSTIRVRPTSAAPTKAAGADSHPRLPLGELAATGRTCPQTGWWEPGESHDMAGGQPQHIKAGERMPHVVSLGEPSIWQKLKGERPSYRTATVWKLVSYDDAPVHPDVAIQAPAIAQTSPPGLAVKDAEDGTDEGGKSEKTPPQKKG